MSKALKQTKTGPRSSETPFLFEYYYAIVILMSACWGFILLNHIGLNNNINNNNDLISVYIIVTTNTNVKKQIQ